MLALYATVHLAVSRGTTLHDCIELRTFVNKNACVVVLCLMLVLDGVVATRLAFAVCGCRTTVQLACHRFQPCRGCLCRTYRVPNRLSCLPELGYGFIAASELPVAASACCGAGGASASSRAPASF